MINAPASASFHRLTILEIEKEKLGSSLLFSILTHACLIFAVFLLPGIMGSRNKPWGEETSGGGAISVGIVRNLHGLNLPRPELTTQTNIATESKGAGVTEPPKVEKKEIEVPDPKAFQIEEKKKKEREKTEKPPARKAPTQVAKVEPPSNLVPFGQGGSPDFSYAEFQGPGGTGGIGFGSGIYGERYGWYVRQVKDIVSANWQKNMVDPNVPSAPKVFIQFEILRDGTPANEFVKQSSGVPSLDRSGIRAIRASHFPPLPGGETRVTVEFFFEYTR